MFCMYCGTKLPDGARFCTNCGAALQGGGSGQGGRTSGGGNVFEEAMAQRAGTGAGKAKKIAPRNTPAAAQPQPARAAQPQPSRAARKKSGKKGGGLLKIAALAAVGAVAVNVITEVGGEGDPFEGISGVIEQELGGWENDGGGYSDWSGQEEGGTDYSSYDDSDYDGGDWEFDDGFKPFLETVPLDNPDAVSIMVQQFKENTGGAPAVEHTNVVSLTEEQIEYYVMIEGENVLRERASRVAHRENPEIGIIEVEHFQLPVTNDITQEEFNRRVEEYVRSNGPEEVWAENYSLD